MIATNNNTTSSNKGAQGGGGSEASFIAQLPTLKNLNNKLNSAAPSSSQGGHSSTAAGCSSFASGASTADSSQYGGYPGHHAGKTNDMKFDCCIEALMKGCVNAYTELFTYSHRPPLCVDALSMSYFSIPDERLPWVMDRLTSAELMRRQSADFPAVVAEHTELSQYFERHGDKQGAIDQLVKAVQVAEDSLDPVLEGETHQTLAFCYERFGCLTESLRHHEIQMRLAEMASAVPSADNDKGGKDRGANAKEVASKNLIHIYDTIGSDYLSRADEIKTKGNKPELRARAAQENTPQSDTEAYQGALERARSYFMKAADVAKNNLAGNEARGNVLLAKCYKKLGHVTVLIGDMTKALEYNQRFLQAARRVDTGGSSTRRAQHGGSGGRAGRGEETHPSIESRAALEVAKVQRSLGNNDEAISSLKEALNVAQRSDDLSGVNRACRQLAETYRSDGQNIPAAHYFRESFKVSQELLQAERAQVKDNCVRDLIDRQKSLKDRFAASPTLPTNKGSGGFKGFVSTTTSNSSSMGRQSTTTTTNNEEKADDEKDNDASETYVLVEDARIRLGFTLGEHYFTHAQSNNGGENRPRSGGNGQRSTNKSTGFLNLVVEDLPAQLEWMSTGSL